MSPTEVATKATTYGESVVQGMFSGKRENQVERHLSRTDILMLVACAYRDGHAAAKREESK